MRYPISINAPSKFILGILGAGPSKSWVEVRPDEIHAQMGWVGEVTIPRQDIATVEKVDQAPWWLGFGVHGMFGTWAFNGSKSGTVKITMRTPARARVTLIPVRPHTIYFSLESPDEFVHEVGNTSP
jgi:hypothetical protein